MMTESLPESDQMVYVITGLHGEEKEKFDSMIAAINRAQERMAKTKWVGRIFLTIVDPECGPIIDQELFFA